MHDIRIKKSSLDVKSAVNGRGMMEVFCQKSGTDCANFVERINCALSHQPEREVNLQRSNKKVTI